MREFHAKLIASAFVLVIFLTGVITGSIAIDWYRHREPTSSESTPHPPPDFGDAYEFQKQLWSQWHWTYGLKSSQGNHTEGWKVKQLCPTFKHDAELEDEEGDLVAYSDGKLFAYDGKVTNVITKLIIKDSTGTPMYVVRSGDAIETVVNANKIYVNLQIRDGQDDLLLGFSEKWNWGFGSKTTVKDSNDIDQFTLERNKLSVKEWIWNVRVKGDTLVDPRLVAMLIGKSSFSSNGEDKTDLCNSAFNALYVTSIVLLSLFAFILVIVGIGLYQRYAKKRHEIVAPRTQRALVELPEVGSERGGSIGEKSRKDHFHDTRGPISVEKNGQVEDNYTISIQSEPENERMGTAASEHNRSLESDSSVEQLLK
eukprot:gb/GECG01002553.1/.p1 GENE.gb/GECG01002553.1/~~gb/GECG01002553.1/.p1  ORF type:complete len:369 (+),score=39.80 gb/GECG01002553.1/:1-1107(+)